jgi:hypothetical protein
MFCTTILQLLVFLCTIFETRYHNSRVILILKNPRACHSERSEESAE